MNEIQLNNDLLSLVIRDVTQTTQEQGKLTLQSPILGPRLGQASNLPVSLFWTRLSPNSIAIKSDFGQETIHFAEHEGVYFLHGYGRNFQATLKNPLNQSGEGSGQGGTIASMPGTVVSISVNEGDQIQKGQLLLTIESMKMLTDITADQDGTVKEIHLSAGDTFDKGAVLVTLE